MAILLEYNRLKEKGIEWQHQASTSASSETTLVVRDSNLLPSSSSPSMSALEKEIENLKQQVESFEDIFTYAFDRQHEDNWSIVSGILKLLMNKASSQAVSIHKCYYDLSLIIKKIIDDKERTMPLFDKWIPRIISLLGILRELTMILMLPMRLNRSM